MDLDDRELEAEAFEQGYLETLNEETAVLKEIQRKHKRERAKRRALACFSVKEAI